MLKKFALKLEKFLQTDDVLHEYQREILTCSAADLRTGNWGGVICEPTGVGKTTIMGAEVKALGYDSLILVPKKTIANNTRDEFRDILGIPEEDIGVYHSDIPIAERRDAAGKKILITTPDSLRGLIKRKELDPDRFKYVAIDEAHKFRGPYTRALLQEYVLHGQEIMVRAYTATDQFLDGTTVGTVLFDRTDYIHHTTLAEAVQKGFLCGVQNIILHSEIKYEGNNPTGELTEKELETLASRLGRDEKTISYFAQYVHEESGTVLRDKPSIWYATSIEHANKVADDLNKVFGDGYAVAVSGESKNQKDILDDHKAGKFKAIINADLLVEGWNNPACVTCVMLRDTISPIIETQAPGRVMRLDPNNPFKIAFVINTVDIGRPFSLTFADIIGGPAILPTGFTYPDGQKPKPSRLTGGKKLVDIGDIKVTFTDEEYLTYTKDRQDERDSVRAPEKPEGMLPKTEYAKFISTSPTNPKFNEFWEQLEDGKDPLEPPLKSGYYLSRVHKVFCIDIVEAERVKKYLGIVTDKPKGMLNKAEFAALIKISYNNPKFNEFWAQLEAGKDPFKPPLKSGIYGKRRSFFIDQSEGERVKKSLDNTTTKPEGMLRKAEFASLIKTASENPKFAALWSLLEEGKDQFQPPLKSGKYGAKKSFHVDESEAERVKVHIGIAASKPQGMLTKVEFIAHIQTSPSNPKFVALWAQLEAGKDPFEPPLKSGTYGGAKTFCVDESEGERVKEYIGIVADKPQGMLTKVEYAKFIGVASTNPKFTDFWAQLEAGKYPLEPPLQSGNYGRHKTFCVDKSEAELVKEYSGLIIDKPAGMLTRREFAQFIKTAPENPKIIELWKQLEAGKDLFQPPLKSGVYGRFKTFYVDQSEGPRVKEYLQKQKGNPSPVVRAEDTQINEGKKRDNGKDKEK